MIWGLGFRYSGEVGGRSYRVPDLMRSMRRLRGYAVPRHVDESLNSKSQSPSPNHCHGRRNAQVEIFKAQGIAVAQRRGFLQVSFLRAPRSHSLHHGTQHPYSKVNC